jgi:hypothetical protein
MAELVYILCFLTSLACCILLVRSYRSSRTRLLLWSSICFAGLALNNGLLYVDAMVPAFDLSMPRALVGLAAVSILIYGIIRDVH